MWKALRNSEDSSFSAFMKYKASKCAALPTGVEYRKGHGNKVSVSEK